MSPALSLSTQEQRIALAVNVECVPHAIAPPFGPAGNRLASG
jgi:hypothetical protein